MIVEYRETSPRNRRRWGRLAGYDLDSAAIHLKNEWPDKSFELRIKRGRPEGFRKPNPASERIAVRLTPERREKLERAPGDTITDKIGRWLDTI